MEATIPQLVNLISRYSQWKSVQEKAFAFNSANKNYIGHIIYISLEIIIDKILNGNQKLS